MMPLKDPGPIRTTGSIQKCNKNIAQKSDLFLDPFTDMQHEVLHRKPGVAHL
jgi:hypothetical protein